MTSAELLRRAAEALRATAGNDVTPAPWSVYFDASLDEHTVRGPNRATQIVGTFDDQDADAAYIALMHPPVALALADLLDTAAFVADGNGLVDDDRYKDEGALARAILREES